MEPFRAANLRVGAQIILMAHSVYLTFTLASRNLQNTDREIRAKQCHLLAYDTYYLQLQLQSPACSQISAPAATLAARLCLIDDRCARAPRSLASVAHRASVGDNRQPTFGTRSDELIGY